MRAISDATQAFLDGLFDLIKASAIAWIAIIAIALLLALPTQIHEYYRVVAIDLALGGNITLTLKFYIFAVAASVIGYLAIIALYITDQRLQAHPDNLSRTLGESTATTIAILLPCAGLVTGLLLADFNISTDDSKSKVAIALVQAAFEDGVSQANGRSVDATYYSDLLTDLKLDWQLHRMAIYAALIGGMLAMLANLPVISRSSRTVAHIWSRRSGALFLAVLLIYAFCSYYIYNNLTELSTRISTFGYLTLGLCLGVILLTSLAAFSRKFHFPFCFLFLAWPLILSFFGWTDNDKIANWKLVETQGSKAEKADKIIEDYVSKRLDHLGRSVDASADDPPIPLYVVAAPGGGLYASYFASNVLTQLSESVPAFRKYLLAVSSVSGGSLGTALFSALYQNNKGCSGYVAIPVDDQKSNQLPQLPRIHQLQEFHEYDFLAPLTGALLFLDTVQAFYPKPLPHLDRARALEGAIEEAWQLAKKDAAVTNGVIGQRRRLPSNLKDQSRRPLDCPVATLGLSQDGPVVLFNVTDVGTGDQRAISNLPWARSFPPSQTADIHIVTAAALSARFPFITPPGWFVHKQDDKSRKVYLVDGGYYENSGVGTARALIEQLSELRAGSPVHNIAIRLVVLIGPKSSMQNSDEYLSELLSPIRALGRSRGARGRNYVASAQKMPRCDDAKKQAGEDCHLVVGLQDFFYPLPLGWDMSELSRLVIQAQNGKYDTCRKDNQAGHSNAACLIEFVKSDLK